MPHPDVLPTEIWHHIVSVSRLQDAELIPWLQIAPFSCARGMHTAAFAHLFRALSISTIGKNNWLEDALYLSRCVRETQISSAARVFTAHWNAGHSLEAKHEINIRDFEKRERHMKMMEDLICDVLNRLENLRELNWFNGNVPTLSIKDKIYDCLQRHFPPLTGLCLAGILFYGPLDLRSATCLSKLTLKDVRLTSTSTTPSILLDTKITTLSLTNVLSRDISCPWWLWEDLCDFDAPTHGLNNPASHIVASLDLSRIIELHCGDDVEWDDGDFSHLFPRTPCSESVGERLVSLSICKPSHAAIEALSKCLAYPRLSKLTIELNVGKILNKAEVDKTLFGLSSFIGKHEALTELTIKFADLEEFHLDDFAGQDAQSFEEFPEMESFRDVLARLKSLRHLQLMTYALGSRYPVLDVNVVQGLCALETLTVYCVITPTLNENRLAEVAMAFGRLPSLRSVKLSTWFWEDGEPESDPLAQAFSQSLQKHAPRIKYCDVQGTYFRL